MAGNQGRMPLFIAKQVDTANVAQLQVGIPRNNDSEAMTQIQVNPLRK